MLFPEYTLDDLAAVWTWIALAAFVAVMVWPMRHRAARTAELARFRADPLFYFLALAAVVSTLGFLIWIATGGRLLSLWTLVAAFAFGLLAYSRVR